MNYVYGLLIAAGLLVGAYWMGGHNREKALEASGVKAVAEARAQAAEEQKREDAIIAQRQEQALSAYRQSAASAQVQLAEFKNHTQQVIHVPEVANWYCTPIPVALVGMRTVRGETCSSTGTDKVSPHTPGVSHSP